jgi:Homeodomain-like domain
MAGTSRARRVRRGAAGGPVEGVRSRVNQETVDEMAALRRQGLTLDEIGARLGCSERTVRRYAGRVEPQIHLPPATPGPEAVDPRVLRESLARWFSDFLYRFEEFPQPCMSVRFMSESTRLIRERLAEMDKLTLELVSRDRAMKDRFLKEVVGPVYADFRNYIQFDMGIGCIRPETSAATWRPQRERPSFPAPDDDEFCDPDEDP